MRFFLLSIIIFLISQLVYASASDDLTSLLNTIHTIKADFKQTIEEKGGSAVQHTAGHMAMQRPGKFHWQVTQPNAQLIVTNGQRLWIYDPDLEQVTIRALSKEVGDAPALLLSDTSQTLDKKFVVQELQNNTASMRWFLLTPKDKNSMFAAIKVGFMNNQLHAMKLQDHLGHATEIEFTHIQSGMELPAALFTFSPPKNIDVIDETKRR